MSIRLNKAIKECNVGLQTAVEFLQKKGFTDVEEDLNAKISDEQYQELLKEFKPDSVLKNQANLMLQQQKEARAAKEQAREEARAAKAAAEAAAREAAAEAAAVEAQKPAFKVVGKIDLDKKPAAPKAEEPVEDVAPAVPEEKAETPAAKEQPSETPAGKAEPAAPAEPVETPAEPAEAPAAETVETEPAVEEMPHTVSNKEVTLTEENGIYKVQTSAPQPQGLTVKGHIDLDSLNQSTRPKKKTKEEKNKERQQAQAQRSKRVRIGERVDINKVAGENRPQTGGKKNGQPQNQPQGKVKKGKKNQPQVAEVSEEEVAKQVRETLARLTAGKNQQFGKGAKYRREKRESIRASGHGGGAGAAAGREQGPEADRVRDGQRTGHHDERARHQGHRHLYEPRRHGQHQPAHGQGDHRPGGRRVRIPDRIRQRRRQRSRARGGGRRGRPRAPRPHRHRHGSRRPR